MRWRKRDEDNNKRDHEENKREGRHDTMGREPRTLQNRELWYFDILLKMRLDKS